MKAAPRSGVTGGHQVHTQPAMNVISHEYTSQKGFSVQRPLQLECLKINHYMRTPYQEELKWLPDSHSSGIGRCILFGASTGSSGT